MRIAIAGAGGFARILATQILNQTAHPVLVLSRSVGLNLSIIEKRLTEILL